MIYFNVLNHELTKDGPVAIKNTPQMDTDFVLIDTDFFPHRGQRT